MMFWTVFLLVLFIASIILAYKKVFVGSAFCFGCIIAFGTSLPAVYSFLSSNAMIKIVDYKLVNFSWSCSLATWSSCIGAFITIIVIFLKVLKKQEFKE